MVLAFAALFMLVNPAKVDAFNPLLPSSGTSLPTDVYNYLTNCDSGSYSPAFRPYISAANDTSQTVVYVPYGATYVDLKYVQTSAVCFSSDPVTASNQQLTSATPGVSNVVGATIPLSYQSYGPGTGAPNVAGTYRAGVVDFRYSPPGGFTASGDYNMQINVKTINQFQTGFVQCVAVGPGTDVQTTDLNNFSRCTSGGVPSTIKVVVEGIPAGAATANCVVGFQGFAFDDDDVTRPLTVGAGIDTNSSNPYVTSMVANQPIAAQFNPTGLAGFGIINKGFTIPIPNQYKDGLPHDWVIFTTNTIGTGPSGLIPIGGGTFTCPTPANYSLDLTVDCVVETNASVTFGVRNNGPDAANGLSVDIYYKFGVDATNPTHPAAIPLNLANGASWSRPVTGTLSPGQSIWARLVVSSGGSTVKENSATLVQCGPLANKPYFKVYGGDVIAGSSYGTNGICIPNSTASIKAYASKDGSGAWRGSSTQFAAQALGTIDGFYSAGMRGAAAGDSRPALGLSFGNYSVPPAPGLVGDNAGGKDSSKAARCLPDFYGIVKAASDATGASANYLPLSALTSGTNTISPTTVSTRPYLFDTHYFLYHEGSDITITANEIILSSTGVSGGSGQTMYGIQDIPSLYIIVKDGNINIAPNVTRLDGVYVAQNGSINTCATVDKSLCGNNLTVNGTFIANNVLLNRTRGDVASSVPNEGPSPLRTAEIFNFIPELWLANLNSGPGTSPLVKTYDSIVGLPPIL